MCRFRLPAGLLLLTFGVARGDPPPGVKPVRVELRPAVPPSPVLRYPLLPELRDQKPGNAAPLYSAAYKNAKDTLTKANDLRWMERISRWRELPPDKFPREQARAFFAPLEPAIAELTAAARHEYADWDLTEKARKFGYNLPLMHLQELRESAQLLEIHARLALVDGRLDDAVHDLQTILTMGQHVSRGPAPICPLVGIAIASLATTQLDQLIQHPAAANFYWCLSDLPRPLIDLRLSMQGEAVAARGSFPYLPDSPRAKELHTMTPAEISKAFQTIADFQGDDVFGSAAAYKTYVGLDMQQKHERAKRELAETGWPRDALDHMPHIEVALLHGLLDFDRYLDEAVKWHNVPYWEAAPALLELDSKARSPLRGPLRGINRPDGPAIPVRTFVAGAHGRVYFARTRLERKIAALRCLEAIRLHTAGNSGKLPASLDEIKVVTVPVDPFTGKAFEYQRDGDRATLYGRALERPGQNRGPNPQDALLYEITLKR
jgi:hypothetical protein